MHKLMRRVVAPIVLIGALLAGGHAEAYYPCYTWVTTVTTPKSYSTCLKTYLGLWTAPVGATACGQYVSWRRYQQRVNGNLTHYRYNRTLLENEVRAVIHVGFGPLAYTYTQTLPGSHTTSVIAQSYAYGTYHCGTTGGSSGTW